MNDIKPINTNNEWIGITEYSSENPENKSLEEDNISVESFDENDFFNQNGLQEGGTDISNNDEIDSVIEGGNDNDVSEEKETDERNNKPELLSESEPEMEGGNDDEDENSNESELKMEGGNDDDDEDENYDEDENDDEDEIEGGNDSTYANTVSSPNSPNENINDFDLEDSIKFINSEINDSDNDTSIVLTLSPSPIPRKVKRSFLKDITQNTFMGMLIFNFLVNS